jgi:phage terminase small subunit
MLTAKQEKFVQGLVKGLSQRQAYKEAYNAENMADSSVDVEAWKTMQLPHISQRYNELMQETVDETILTVQEKRRMYREFAQDKTLSMTDRLKAMDQDSKLGGEYTTKIEGNLDVTTITITLDDEEQE